MNNAEVLIKFKGDTKDLDKKTEGVSSKLKGFASAAGKGFAVAGAAVGAASVAVGKLVKSSVDAYAEFEQLEGGLESLFGKGSSEMESIMKTSKEAYKKLTMSQNDYLKAFEGTYSIMKNGMSENGDAIEYTNKMLQISSDLYNTYGGSVDQYSNAINWALKGTYSYLDNLNIGIKGTQEGFIEAANKSGVLGRTIQDVSDLTNDEIIDVIEHYTQAAGALGKTEAEASTTIQGSLNMTKASWNDLISAFAKGDDLSKPIDNFINSAMTFADNVIPVITRALSSIADALPTIVDKIVDILPDLIQGILPGLIEGAISLLKGLGEALPTIIPILMDAIVQAIKGLAEILPVLIQALVEGLVAIIQALAEAMPELIPIIVDAILSVIPILIENLPLFIKAGYQLIGGILAGIINAIPGLLARVLQIVIDIIAYFKQLPSMALDCGKNLLKGLWNGINSMKDWVIDKVKSIGKSILKGLKGILGIHSPSTETAWMAEMLGLGMTKELDKIAPEIQKTIDSTFAFNPTMANTSSLNMSKNITVYNNVDVKQDALGQMVSDIKTFSGGAKNDYNYGMS